MTAISTGVKTHMGAIGVSAGPKDDCTGSLDKSLLTWLQLADSANLATGIVSTARLTHATPAATYAPVSYTHLDVYKRQVPGTPAVPKLPSTEASRMMKYCEALRSRPKYWATNIEVSAG